MAPDFDDIIRVLADHQRFLLIPHDRADGDACGSMLALALALEKAGKEVHTLLLNSMGSRYAFIFEDCRVPILGQDVQPDSLPEVDVALVIDTSAMRQLSPIADWLMRFGGLIATIDHHEPGDLPARVACIDEASPAAGIIIARLLERLGWLEGPQIARYLLIAVATDTGWFSYNNVTPECFTWAGRFGAMGADLHELYERLFLSEPPERFKLVAQTLCSAELLADDSLVVFTLTRKDFAETGASDAMTENLIDLSGRLRTMSVGVLFVEGQDGSVRISLRSRRDFNVHEFAQIFGGGGHRQAAGIRLTGSLDEVKQTVLAKLIERLTENRAGQAYNP
ncbi:MAG: bifunctional oligoribonuclease/PAP phosphatase NrnA [Phycisphaerae bacterium]|nr:bifunctional oligoribonuclease/PAP phosphatase NrnA [Phycisphaerae bacterium]